MFDTSLKKERVPLLPLLPLFVNLKRNFFSTPAKSPKTKEKTFFLGSNFLSKSSLLFFKYKWQAKGLACNCTLLALKSSSQGSREAKGITQVLSVSFLLTDTKWIRKCKAFPSKTELEQLLEACANLVELEFLFFGRFSDFDFTKRLFKKLSF